MFAFEYGRPEEYNIPVEAIEKMERLFEKRRVRIHGYMLLGGKKVLKEHFYGTYGRNDKHRMYSITKSFVALAIGLLEKNGLIRLDDKICDYFPDKLPEDGAHPWCAEMTIRDMLTMTTCHSTTTYKRYDSEDWTESFFRVKPDHVPGTVFSYDTSSSHTLGALVERLTGMNVLDYMRKEMLNELSFSEDAYIIPDPVGVSMGGSGMMCSIEDVAKVAYLCNHYGCVDGKQLLSENFIREAISNQVPTDIQVKLDERFGYGYFIWMTREEGFVFYGLGGQLAVCFPKFDFCYLTIADGLGSPTAVQILMDCFYETVYPYLKERKEDNPVAFSEGNSDAEATFGTKNASNVTTDIEQIKKETDKKLYKFYPNALEWNHLVFDWDKNEINFSNTAGDFSFTFGDGNTWEQQPFLNTGYTCECRGYWKQGHFFVESFMIDEEQGNVRMEFAFKDERLTLHTVSASEPFFANMASYFNGFASAER